MTSDLRPVPELDEWVQARCPELEYGDGQPVQIGDAVDYGGRVGIDGIHIDRTFNGDVYWGDVIRADALNRKVLVDEHRNGPPKWYPIEQLDLLSRAQEETS